MKVLGNRVYLSMPDIKKEYTVTVGPELQKQLEQEQMAKFDKLTVFAVGNIGETIPEVEVGNIVFVEPTSLQRATIIEIEGSKKIIVPLTSIMHIW